MLRIIKCSVVQRRRLVMISNEWYADVEMTSIASRINKADLPAIIHVEYGWPLAHIVTSDASGESFSGINFCSHEVGHRLGKLYIDGQWVIQLWPKNMNILLQWTPSGLRVNKHLVKEFS